MERGLSDRLLTAVQQLEGGTATSLPYSTNLTARTPTVRTDEQGRIVNTGQAVAGALEGAYTAAEDLVMQVLNMGPARIRQGPPVGFTAGPMDQQVRDDYTLDDKARDALRIIGELGNMTRFGDQTPYETPYPEATASERFIAGAATPDGGDVGRLIEGAIPFLRLTRRSAPKAADIIEAAASNASTMSPVRNMQSMLRQMRDANKTYDGVGFDIDYERTGSSSFTFTITDPRTRTFIRSSVYGNEMNIDLLDSVRSSREGVGAGANLSGPLMNVVLEMADAAGMRVTTQPSGMGRLSTSQLRDMYAKLGFKAAGPNDSSMIRDPLSLDFERRQQQIANTVDLRKQESVAERLAEEQRAAQRASLSGEITDMDYIDEWIYGDYLPPMDEWSAEQTEALINFANQLINRQMSVSGNAGIARIIFDNLEETNRW